MAFSLPPPPAGEDITSHAWRDWFWKLIRAFQTAGSTVVDWGGITGTLANQTDLQASLDGKQVGLQFQDEGSNLGTSGTVTAVDIVGAGATATRSVNKVTLTIPGGTSYTDEQAQDAIGSILVDSSTVDFTYDDATPSITAVARTREVLVDDDMNLLFDDNGDLLYED